MTTIDDNTNTDARKSPDMKEIKQFEHAAVRTCTDEWAVWRTLIVVLTRPLFFYLSGRQGFPAQDLTRFQTPIYGTTPLEQ
jgi:hypothetical protein